MGYQLPKVLRPSKTESGGVREWSKRAVLKTAEAKVSVGSNPTPSANSHCGLCRFGIRGTI